MPPDQVDEIWRHVEPLLRKATERCGDWTTDALRREIASGALLWITWDGSAIRAACVTRLQENRTGRACYVIAVGGEQTMPWTEAMATVERYAREQGCAGIRIEGRAGWGRVLYGFAPRWTVFEKRL